MLDRIIKFSIQYKPAVGLMIVSLLAWGTYSLTRLPIDAVPDITNNQVQIITRSPAFGAQDIERIVTFPIEQSMANIPHLIEMRSFSRFGLSVVTLVFKDDIDVYWARQQVGERLSQIRGQIPPAIGEPEMAPVTTGLGEIFQYVIKVDHASGKTYTASELRSIQDWIIRRQLLGTEGVADVSSFGGHIKQYEIAMNPQQLKSMNVSITEIFSALERNNQNTGGAYIDKNPEVYFIRTEALVQSIIDIEQIVIRTQENGMPLRVKDVAKVGIGHATRYGAMTYNSDGESVGGIVLMLKGANSSKVIQEVKSRITDISKALPKGISIEPYLDRTKLVNSAIKTVSKNLIEGALIVIFVLVIMLGNFRAGLIVASVIPLAMLFALGMMNVFGVSGNLMSLGAIDFGIIVDGAVIIVEATMHHLYLKNRGKLSQQQMDMEVYQSASSIRSSAAFGEMIILIVYLPILALVGIEGKMFKPMAQTVSFAILGAFLLSITYVPAVSALFLNKNIVQRRTLSDRFITFLQVRYEPLLRRSLNQRKQILAAVLLLFTGSVYLFNQLGAEFIPTLDEGDFAVETRVLPGSSLSKSIDVSQKSAQVLLDHFPEVKSVVGKIGSSEIPVDPMPLEACDLIVILKEKEEWTSASSREELANKMQEELENHLPGVTYGFQQPIQMRFNELMTGARQDVVVKIFGEDLNKLAAYAHDAGSLISKVEGAEDIYVEPISGIAQIVVKIKREKLAQYATDVETVNNAIFTAFAGSVAGFVYEQERRYDMVLRLDSAHRRSIEDLKQLYVTNSQDAAIPLDVLADIKLETSPNQIQRDEGKRRVVVGFNVRGRDVKSVVEEIQLLIDEKIKLQPGYLVSYGGAFKNMEEATLRLSFAVPAALLLILILLYFTFGSVGQALLIFVAVPLSAMGGIWALWLRDMPFSISAGIGFIALFGVAVLNGIVLVAEFNRLKREGETNIQTIILKATAIRLRPVLITAMVASLGFLPMALSHGSGAEVQKPLATVVIGGLITATLLTLFIIPIIYSFMQKKIHVNKAILLVVLGLTYTGTQAQSPSAKTVSVELAIEIAMQNNQMIQQAKLETSARKKQQTASGEWPKTDLGMMYGQYNSFSRNDNNFSISQTIPFSTFTGSNRTHATSQWKESKLQYEQKANELKKQIRETYNQLVYLYSLKKLLVSQDSMMQQMQLRTAKRYDAGEVKYLELSAINAQRSEAFAAMLQVESEIVQWNKHFNFLLQDEINYIPKDSVLYKLDDKFIQDSLSISYNPSYKLANQQNETMKKQHQAAVSRTLPDLKVGYFNQTLIGFHNVDGVDKYFGAGDRFQGLQLGMSLPLWFIPQKAKLDAIKIEKAKAMAYSIQTERTLLNQLSEKLETYNRYNLMLNHYEKTALIHMYTLQQQTQSAYRNGEISYHEFLQNMRMAVDQQLRYQQIISQFNQSIIDIQFLIAQ
jgi:cobalt-zinc-cadmium resistance protein CzcA